jgi:uncharacterized damage-inducible protein DinB
MTNINLGVEYLKELEAEAGATRKCLDRISENLFSWKPHEKSMNLGYLTLLVAEIPLWIAYIVEKGEIDYGTFKHIDPKTTKDVVDHHDENMEAARRALQHVTNEELLEGKFILKYNGQELFSSSKKFNVSSTINHLVHHRGQLTVYMRLNDIPVPSIYGPSADDRSF